MGLRRGANTRLGLLKQWLGERGAVCEQKHLLYRLGSIVLRKCVVFC